jgi:hypothetical protein
MLTLSTRSSYQVLENHWLGGRDSNPDTQIQSPLQALKAKRINDLSLQIKENPGKTHNAGATNERRMKHKVWNVPTGREGRQLAQSLRSFYVELDRQTSPNKRSMGS